MAKKREGEKTELIAAMLIIFIVFPVYLYDHLLGGLAVIVTLGWLVAYYPRKNKKEKK